jgi:hypothetical protein
VLSREPGQRAGHFGAFLAQSSLTWLAPRLVSAQLLVLTKPLSEPCPQELNPVLCPTNAQELVPLGRFRTQSSLIKYPATKAGDYVQVELEALRLKRSSGRKAAEPLAEADGGSDSSETRDQAVI